MRSIPNRIIGRPMIFTGGAPLVIAAGLFIGVPSDASTGGVLCTAGKASERTSATGTKAEPGKPAPDFTLDDLTGRPVRLSQFKGKIVVLEWFNPDCPFVNLAHGRSLSLKGKAAAYKKRGVVWLAVNSNGPGKQGYGKVANERGRDRFGMRHPILLDPTGEVGRTYGALRTPHMFVIDTTGILVYAGAVDNTQGGDPEDAEPPPARNLVDEVISKLLKKEKVAPRKTTPWGCSVKYAQ